MESFSEEQSNKMLNGIVEGPLSEKTPEPAPTEIQEPSTDGRTTPELDFKEVPDSPYLQEKAKQLEVALDKAEILIKDLQKYALSEGGFVNDKLRKKGWPRLLGIDPLGGEAMPDEATLRQHPEFTQVVLDVNRSLKRFPPGIPYEQRVALQDQLTNLILRVITKYPHLRYYQGYHDVAVTFLLVVGEELAFRIMERLSTNHLKDCMEPTMEKTSHLLNYIYPLINRLHPRLCVHLEKSGVGTMFCLPWFLTWYGHSLNRYKDVVRLYDFFLATEALMPLYLAAVIVVHRQEEILQTDCDMASIHCLLSQIPDNLPFQTLIEESIDLYDKFPPVSVEAEVIERTNREKEMRKAEEAMIKSRRKGRGGEVRKSWGWLVERYVPRSKTQLFLLAVSLAMGLYAYLRAEVGDVTPTR